MTAVTEHTGGGRVLSYKEAQRAQDVYMRATRRLWCRWARIASALESPQGDGWSVVGIVESGFIKVWLAEMLARRSIPEVPFRAMVIGTPQAL